MGFLRNYSLGGEVPWGLANDHHAVFCSPPEGAVCLTCGTHLQLGEYGGKPAVVAKRKKKRKKGLEG